MVIEAGASVLGKREHPPGPEDDRIRLSDWKAAVRLKCMDNSLRACLLRQLKQRINRHIYRKRVHEQALRIHSDRAPEEADVLPNTGSRLTGRHVGDSQGVQEREQHRVGNQRGGVSAPAS